MTIKDLSKIEKALFDINKEKYDEAVNPLRSHGPDHHRRVYQYAIKLANRLKVVYDPEVLAGAALLHDMAAYYPEQTGEAYHDFDHKLAEGLLRGINFPSDKIPATLYAIAHHGSDPKYKKADEPIEVILLRDADKLDVFGPIGIARIIMVRTLKGDALPDIIADFYTGGHLERKWDSITTSEARDMARNDYDYAMSFFEKLASSLEVEASPHN